MHCNCYGIINKIHFPLTLKEQKQVLKIRNFKRLKVRSRDGWMKALSDKVRRAHCRAIF